MECAAHIGLFACLGFLALANGGCFTAALWENVNPNERVWIPCSRVTEEELKARGVQYEHFRQPTDALNKAGIEYDEPNVDGYLVAKSGPQKLRDYVILAAATPFTLVVDGVVISAVAVLYVCAWLQWPPTSWEVADSPEGDLPLPHVVEVEELPGMG